MSTQKIVVVIIGCLMMLFSPIGWRFWKVDSLLSVLAFAIGLYLATS